MAAPRLSSTCFEPLASAAAVNLALMAARLDRAARIDHLTSVANRKTFFEGAEAIVGSEAFKEGAVLFIDADHFKSVNDTFGHAIGDAVLQEMGSVIRKRLGGAHRRRGVRCVPGRSRPRQDIGSSRAHQTEHARCQTGSRHRGPRNHRQHRDLRARTRPNLERHLAARSSESLCRKEQGARLHRRNHRVRTGIRMIVTGTIAPPIQTRIGIERG
ncbi:MAG: diguanylate cyclase [Mesorhizobium sp.]|nr:MAG: diguanylate cyclase [Mesorhizobium sp.]